LFLAALPKRRAVGGGGVLVPADDAVFIAEVVMHAAAAWSDGVSMKLEAIEVAIIAGAAGLVVKAVPGILAGDHLHHHKASMVFIGSTGHRGLKLIEGQGIVSVTVFVRLEAAVEDAQAAHR